MVPPSTAARVVVAAAVAAVGGEGESWCRCRAAARAIVVEGTVFGGPGRTR